MPGFWQYHWVTDFCFIIKIIGCEAQLHAIRHSKEALGKAVYGGT